MIEENGHIWDDEGENRCHRCQLKRRQYLEFKAGVEQEVDEIEERLMCKEPQPVQLPEKLTASTACVQIDLFDVNTGRWDMLLNRKFDDVNLALHIKTIIEMLLDGPPITKSFLIGAILGMRDPQGTILDLKGMDPEVRKNLRAQVLSILDEALGE